MTREEILALHVAWDFDGALHELHRALALAGPEGVMRLLLAVREGRFDGGTYYGPCRCVYGTLGEESDLLFGLTHAAALDLKEAAVGHKRYEGLSFTDLEEFVMSIGAKQTPATNKRLAWLELHTLAWLDAHPVPPQHPPVQELAHAG